MIFHAAPAGLGRTRSGRTRRVAAGARAGAEAWLPSRLRVALACCLIASCSHFLAAQQPADPAVPDPAVPDPAVPDPAASDAVSFRRDIAPLLLDRCLPCHGPKKAEGGYRVDTFARASGQGDSELPGFVAGDLEGSEAFRRLVTDDETERMPANSEPLPADQLAALRRWIEAGAKFDAPDPQTPLISIIPPVRHPQAPAVYPHSLPITALTFAAGGEQLIASGYHELTVWRVADGQLERRVGGLPRRTLALNLSPSGELLAVAGGNPGQLGEVRLLRWPTGALRQVLGQTSDVVLDVAFRPDGARLATAAADGAVRLFQVADGAETAVINSHSDWVHAVAWSRDGKQLATASRDKTAKVFDAESAELLGSYGEHAAAVQGIAFAEDGKQLLSAGDDRKIHRWTIADSKRQGAATLGGEVFKLRVFGDWLLAPSADRTVRRLVAADLNETRQYAGAGDWVLCADHHAESGRVAAGCFNGEIIVWNAETGEELRRWNAKITKQPRGERRE